MASSDLEDRVNSEIMLLQEVPSKRMDDRLFEQAELLLSRTMDKNERLKLVHRLARLLEVLQQDPTPVINLIIKLTDDFDYADVLDFDNIPYVEGLSPGELYTSYNRLIISILSKATKRPADAAHVASKLDTMLALVTLWLCTSDTGIASQVHRLLLDLLKVDRQIPPGPGAHVPSGGQSLVWKRIFGDRDVYSTILTSCSLSPPKNLNFLSGAGADRSLASATEISPFNLSKNQRTLAQSRLMEWLPAVGVMDWTAITRSHHPDIEALFGVKEGLLEFAVLKMVDFEGDVLMYRCLIDFYSDLLHSFKSDPGVDTAVHDSPTLRYLIDKGVHARTAALYLDVTGMEPVGIDLRFVYGPAANYVATYASSYPDHFLSGEMPKRVNKRLMTALDLSPNRWTANDPPKHDLHVTASIPRQSLLPGGDGSGWFNSTPLSLLPTNLAVPDVLNTLATIFHGPCSCSPSHPHSITFPESPAGELRDSDKREASAARALYNHFLSGRPSLWRHITDQARIVAMTDAALAAINVIAHVINAKWAPEPEFIMPDDIPLANSGPGAVIMGGPAVSHVLSYLLERPPSFSNLVGGHGDAESAAYRVATAKYDALKMLCDDVSYAVGQLPDCDNECRDLLAMLRNALQQGPFGGSGQDVGGRIGTLDL